MLQPESEVMRGPAPARPAAQPPPSGSILQPESSVTPTFQKKVSTLQSCCKSPGPAVCCRAKGAADNAQGTVRAVARARAVTLRRRVREGMEIPFAEAAPGKGPAVALRAPLQEV